MNTTKKQLIDLLTCMVLDNHSDDAERIIESLIKHFCENPENRTLNKILKDALGEYGYENLKWKVQNPERTLRNNSDLIRRYRECGL